MTLIGLVIQDYIGEEVIRTRYNLWNQYRSKHAYLVQVDPVLSNLPNLPGCYTRSAPAMIAGLW